MAVALASRRPTDKHVSDMDASKLHGVPDPEGQFVISTRIRVGRNIRSVHARCTLVAAVSAVRRPYPWPDWAEGLAWLRVARGPNAAKWSALWWKPWAKWKATWPESA
jgi:hypothetical protein